MHRRHPLPPSQKRGVRNRLACLSGEALRSSGLAQTTGFEPLNNIAASIATNGCSGLEACNVLAVRGSAPDHLHCPLFLRSAIVIWHHELQL